MWPFLYRVSFCHKEFESWVYSVLEEMAGGSEHMFFFTEISYLSDTNSRKFLDTHSCDEYSPLIHIEFQPANIDWGGASNPDINTPEPLQVGTLQVSQPGLHSSVAVPSRAS